MIDTDKYEGHTENWYVDWPMAWRMIRGGVSRFKRPDVQLIADAPLLLAEVKRLQYLEKYAPTFQVFAQNEEDMDEEYTQHGSLKECEEYIVTLEDGWIGSIEVIEHYLITNNPQVKTLEEWRNEE